MVLPHGKYYIVLPKLVDLQEERKGFFFVLTFPYIVKHTEQLQCV
jgi:hypothetical protein